MNSLGIRKDDTVIVLSGKDKGKKGRVLATVPKDGKVIVEGVNIATKHKKPRSQTDPGGIIKQEIPIGASKVQRVCPRCSKPTRVGHVFDAEGNKTRQCKHCKENI